MSVNKVILLGHVGTDPEVRYPEKDFAYARLRLATNEQKGPSNVQITEWHTLTFAGQQARIVERYVRKGMRLYAEGAIRYREYEDKFKIKRRVAEIEVSYFEMLGGGTPPQQ